MEFAERKELISKNRIVNESGSAQQKMLDLSANLFGRETPGTIYSTLSIEESDGGFSFSGELFSRAAVQEVTELLESGNFAIKSIPFVFWKQKTFFCKRHVLVFLSRLVGEKTFPLFSDPSPEEIQNILKEYDFFAEIGDEHSGESPDSEAIDVDICSISSNSFAGDPLLRLFPLKNRNAFPRVALSNRLYPKITQFFKNKSYFPSWNKGLPIDEIKAWDVGQANFLIGCSAGAPRFCFDIGLEKNEFLSMGKKAPPHQQSINFLSSLNNDGFIFISHFDTDHFLGFGLADLSNKSSFAYRKWILPDPRRVFQKGLFLFSFAAFVLLSFLLSRGSSEVFILSARTLSPKKLRNITFTHSLGKTSNDSSLFCVINNQNKGKKCVLPGDADYLMWPSPSHGINFNGIDYLVVPHHGGGATIAAIPVANQGAKAVILCGNNWFGHPNYWHVLALLGKQFSIWRFPIANSLLYLFCTSRGPRLVDCTSKIAAPPFYSMPL